MAGVLRHPAASALASSLTKHLPGRRAVWLELEKDDVLAAQLARLYLWADPRPLPRRGDAAGAWNYYIRVWRPGKPHQATWAAFYRQAEELVYGSAQAD